MDNFEVSLRGRGIDLRVRTHCRQVMFRRIRAAFRESAAPERLYGERFSPVKAVLATRSKRSRNLFEEEIEGTLTQVSALLKVHILVDRLLGRGVGLHLESLEDFLPFLEENYEGLRYNGKLFLYGNDLKYEIYYLRNLLYFKSNIVFPLWKDPDNKTSRGFPAKYSLELRSTDELNHKEWTVGLKNVKSYRSIGV